MDAWIEFARGPLFRVALAACLLGLGYHLLNTLWMIRRSWARAADKDIPLRKALVAASRALVPLHRGRPLQTAASLALHAGVLLVPLFYVGHVNLWRPARSIPWPTLGPVAGDLLSLAAITGLAALVLERWLSRTARELSSRADVGLLLLLLAVTGSGYWAAHPMSSPLAPRAMLLVHVLAADLALFLTPLTKLVHCVLAPVNYVLTEVCWHFPAESGAHVALALGKENEPI
jgi:nitrate reductase gamma subunit